MYSSRRPFTSERLIKKSKKPPYIQIFFIVLCFISFVIYSSISSVGNTLVEEKSYLIGKGDTIRILNEKFDFSITSWRYSLWIKWFAPEVKNLQVGQYKVSTPTTLSEFFSTTLTKPTHTDETITILPGWNIYDIDSYLADKKIAKTGDFLSNMANNFSLYEEEFDFLRGRESLEGFLYPDTYRIRTDATVHDITRILLKQFDKTVGESYRALGDNAYQELILASIVVREERISANQSIVAGILAKRVREGIPMGADATVCTGYAKTQKQCTPSFIGEVIYQKHPFNTRNRQGYPPTPISNITLSVWNNTLEKKSSPYYYYLHDSDGLIHFARTLDEHVQNKNTYLR